LDACAHEGIGGAAYFSVFLFGEIDEVLAFFSGDGEGFF